MEKKAAKKEKRIRKRIITKMVVSPAECSSGVSELNPELTGGVRLIRLQAAEASAPGMDWMH